MPEPNEPVAPQGQAQEAPPVEGQGITPPADSGQGDYFYSWTDPAKNETKNFRNQDELSSYVGNLNKSYGELRKKFTQTTQEYADKNRAYENDRAEFNRKLSELEKRESEIKKYDEYLKNNPHVYRELKQRIDKGPSGGDINSMIEAKVKEIYGDDFSALKAHKAKIEGERLRDAAFEELQKKYGNIDRDKILGSFDKLSSGNLADVYELLHLAGGTTTAGQAQQAKEGAGILPSETGTPSQGRPSASFKDIDAWVEAQQKAI